MQNITKDEKNSPLAKKQGGRESLTTVFILRGQAKLGKLVQGVFGFAGVAQIKRHESGKISGEGCLNHTQQQKKTHVLHGEQDIKHTPKQLQIATTALGSQYTPDSHALGRPELVPREIPEKSTSAS